MASPTDDPSFDEMAAQLESELDAMLNAPVEADLPEEAEELPELELFEPEEFEETRVSELPEIPDVELSEGLLAALDEQYKAWLIINRSNMSEDERDEKARKVAENYRYIGTPRPRGISAMTTRTKSIGAEPVLTNAQGRMAGLQNKSDKIEAVLKENAEKGDPFEGIKLALEIAHEELIPEGSKLEDIDPLREKWTPTGEEKGWTVGGKHGEGYILPAAGMALGARIGGVKGALIGGGVGLAVSMEGQLPGKTIDGLAKRTAYIGRVPDASLYLERLGSRGAAIAVDSMVGAAEWLGVENPHKYKSLMRTGYRIMREHRERQEQSGTRGLSTPERFLDFISLGVAESLRFGVEDAIYRVGEAALTEEGWQREAIFEEREEYIQAARIPENIRSLYEISRQIKADPRKEKELRSAFVMLLDTVTWNDLDSQGLARGELDVWNFRVIVEAMTDKDIEVFKIEENSPALFKAVQMSKEGRANSYIKDQLKTVAIGTFAMVPGMHRSVAGVLPTMPELEEWAETKVDVVEATGGETMREFQGWIERSMMDVVEHEGTFYVTETTPSKWFRWISGVAPETFLAPAEMALAQISEQEGDKGPTGLLGAPDSAWDVVAAGLARVGTGEIGLHPRLTDMMKARGMQAHEADYTTVSYLANLLDFGIPFESPFFRLAGRGIRTGIVQPMQAVKLARAGRKVGMGPQGFMAGMSPWAYKFRYGLEDADAVTAVNHYYKAVADAAVAQGKNPLDVLPSGVKDNVSEALRVYGLDPEVTLGKYNQYVREGRSVHDQATDMAARGNAPGDVAMRSGEGYQEFAATLDEFAQDGRWDARANPIIKAVFETLGARLAADPDVPIDTPDAFFENVLRLQRGGEPGPHARYQIADDIPDLNPVEYRSALDTMNDLARVDVPKGLRTVENDFTKTTRTSRGQKIAKSAATYSRFDEYRKALSGVLRKHLGDEFNAYALMPKSMLKAWRSGRLDGPISVSLTPEGAHALKRHHPAKRHKNLVMVEVPVRPKDAWMIGSLDDLEIVISAQGKPAKNLTGFPLGAQGSGSTRAVTLADLRGVLDDIGIDPDTNAFFKERLLAVTGKSSIEGLSKTERLRVLQETLNGYMNDEFYGGKKPPGKVVSESILAKLIKKFTDTAPSNSGVPKALTRKSRLSTKKFGKPVPSGTTPRNAEASLARLDEIIAKLDGRNPIENDTDWNRFWAEITGTNEVLQPPWKIREYLRDPEVMAALLRDLTPEQLREADYGVELVAQVGQLYKAGAADVTLTGQLLLWSILSRSLSAFPQEAAFIDAFLANAKPYIRSAARGEFSVAPKGYAKNYSPMLDRYLVWVGGRNTKPEAIERLLGAKEITADQAAAMQTQQPVINPDGPGGGALANLNSFGSKFLYKMGRPLPADHPNAGKIPLQLLHDMVMDGSKSSKEIRRDFFSLSEKSGVDNKILSFLLLVSGRTDVAVIDRVQARHFWDSVGHDYAGIREIYEGFAPPTSEKGWQKWGKNPRTISNRRGLADVFTGVRGVALYEVIEDALLAGIDDAYRLAGREGAGSLARFHWESWVANSGQEVGHNTLAILLRDALGVQEPARGVYVREGKFAYRRYGMQYVPLDDGARVYVVEDSAGRPYIFDSNALKRYYDILDKHKDNKNIENRVVHRGFKVSDPRAAGIPWFHRPSVNRANLDRLISDVGRRATLEEAVLLKARARRDFGVVEFPRDRLSDEVRPLRIAFGDRPPPEGPVVEVALTGVQKQRPELFALKARFMGVAGKINDARIAGQDVSDLGRELDGIADAIFSEFEPALRDLIDEPGIEVVSIKRSLGGWAGEEVEPNIRIKLTGDEALIRDRLARFNQTSGMEGPEVVSQGGGLSRVVVDVIDDVPDVVGPGAKALNKATLSKLIWDDGGVERAATMRMGLPDEMLTPDALVAMGRVFEKYDLGWTVDPELGTLELIHTPEWSNQNARDTLSAFVAAARQFMDAARKSHGADIEIAWVKERVLVSAPKARSTTVNNALDTSTSEYTIRSYDQELLSDAELTQRGARLGPRISEGLGRRFRYRVSAAGPGDAAARKARLEPPEARPGRGVGEAAPERGIAPGVRAVRAAEEPTPVPERVGGLRLPRLDERGHFGLHDLQRGAENGRVDVEPDISRALMRELGLEFRLDDAGLAIDTSSEVMIYPLHEAFGTTLEQVVKRLRTWTKTKHTQGDGWTFEVFGPRMMEDGTLGKFEPADFKRASYDQKTAWIYQPHDPNASFGDVAYTYAWRVTHEIAHGITNKWLTGRYGGDGSRAGALGIEAATPSGRIAGPLSLADALRAVEWEHETFIKQRQILESDFGIKITDAQFNKEYALNMADAVHRVLTGKFTTSGKLGTSPVDLVPADVFANAKRILRTAAAEMGLDMVEDFRPRPKPRTVGVDAPSSKWDTSPETVGPLRRGMWLDEAEQALIDADPDIEYVFAVTGDGEHILRLRGNNIGEVPEGLPEELRRAATKPWMAETYVYIPDEVGLALRQSSDTVFTHNHPNGSPMLSPSDVKTAIRLDMAEMRAVTSDGRMMRLIRPEGGWPKELVPEATLEGITDVTDDFARFEYKFEGRMRKAKKFANERMNWDILDADGFDRPKRPDGTHEGFDADNWTRYQREEIERAIREIVDEFAPGARIELSEGNTTRVETIPDRLRASVGVRTEEAAGLTARVPEAPAAVIPTDTPEFRAWFGGSKVVDEAGEPLVVYHGGLDIAGEASFGRRAGPGFFTASERGALGGGIYFTPSKERAYGYAVEYRSPDPEMGGAVTSVYLSLKNPLVLKGEGHPVVEAFVKLGRDRDSAVRMVERIEEEHGYIGKELQREAKKQGYDGIIQYGRAGETISELVAFEPTQVKSTANVGTFGPTDPRIRYQRRDGRALGYFEWDQASAKYVIALFRDGDLNTLWHESGHLVSAIMGDKWMNTLVRHFDNELMPDGRYRLTNLGEEQLADAWMHYMQARFSPSGPVKRLFEQLLWTLKEVWRRLRGKNPAIPREMRDLWDRWLRPDLQVREYAATTQHGVMKTRHPMVVVEPTRAARIEAEAVKKAGRAREAARVDLRPESVRNALGGKSEVYFEDISADPAVHEWAPRRRPVSAEVDAIEVVNRAIAYVATEHFKRSIAGEEWVRLTLRSFIPKTRMNRVARSVRTRLAGALGTQIKNLKVYNKGQDLPAEVSVRLGVQPGMIARIDQPTLELSQAQAAGMKTLVHELAAQPLGNILPDEMLDGAADFSLMTVEQYNRVLEVMMDVEAGVSARATRYAEGISPTLGHAMVGAMKTMARAIAKRSDKVKTIKEKMTKAFVVPRFGEDYMNPVPRDIVQGGLRELNTLDNWLLQMANRAIKEDDATIWREVYKSMIGRLVAPVARGQVSQLFDLVDRLSGVLEAEVRRLGRIERGEISAGDEVRQLTRMEINGQLDTIQGLLQNSGGLTDHERAALRILRTYENTPNEAMEAADLYATGDAIRELHHGLWTRQQDVIARAKELIMGLEGTTDANLLIERPAIEYRMVYERFYDGDFEWMFDWAASKGRSVGADPTDIPDYDQSLAMLEMIARMRTNEIVANMTRRLAEYGVTLDPRKMTEHRKFGPGTSLDRDKFVDRVAFYINKEMSWDSNAFMNRKTGKVDPAPAPPKGMYTIYDMPEGAGPGRWGIGTKDMMAFTKAHDLLAGWGFKLGKGKWERYTMPDGTEALVPLMLIKEIEDAVGRAAAVGQAWTGKKGRALRSVRGNVALDAPTKRPVKVALQIHLANAFDTIMDLNPLTASRIKMGVTVGIGMPNLPYYAGVSLGALFQAYQTQGFFAAGKYLAKMPVSALRMVGRRPDMVGAVVARMWKEGGYTPHAPSIVTRFGQVYTDDMISHMAIREGMNTGFVRAETAQAISLDIQQKMPQFAGWIRKMPRWWQRNLIEIATAMDNYFRVSIFVDELTMGRSPSAAAEIARKAGFDYADLTEFERKYMRNIIMFYSYQRKNLDLFWDTFLRNPERLIAQMRLIRGSQRMVLDEDDPIVVLPDYMQTRLFAGAVSSYHSAHMKSGNAFVLPMLPVEDAVNLLADVWDVGAFKGSERGQDALRGLVSRATPWAQAPFVLAGETDFYFGYDINRNNVVPEWLIELDFNLTGGQLYEFLGVQWEPVKNKAYESVPGRGRFVATNGQHWWIWRNLLQFPGAGRSMDTITSMDRANLGAVETVVELANLFREHIRHPMEDSGWLDSPKTTKVIPYGDDVDAWRRDTMLPRPDLYEGDPTDFAALEFFGLLGARPKALKRQDVREAELFKRQRYVLERALKEMEQSELP